MLAMAARLPPAPRTMPRMIVDVHTHIFPPRMVQHRGRLVTRDPAFAEMYGEASARMAIAETLIESMDAAGVDVSRLKISTRLSIDGVVRGI